MESRRTFTRKILASGLGVSMAGALGSGKLLMATPDRGAGPIATSLECPVCIFSKHLQFLDYGELADILVEAGLDGADLTVRRGGHVEPAKVEEQLPEAVKALKAKGRLVPMMVTRIDDAEDPLTQRILKAASRLGIRHYRMAYYRYERELGIRGTLQQLRPRVQALAELNQQYSIHGAYQNHAGDRVGAPVWDLYTLFEGLDPEWIGCQYDIRHAMVEGMNSWKLGMNLVKPFIRSVVVKDTEWVRRGGQWKNNNVPLGTGITDLDGFLSILKSWNWRGPVSIHFEYPFFDGDDKTLRHDQKIKMALGHMIRDVKYLKDKLTEHGLNT